MFNTHSLFHVLALFSPQFFILNATFIDDTKAQQINSGGTGSAETNVVSGARNFKLQKGIIVIGGRTNNSAITTSVVARSPTKSTTKSTNTKSTTKSTGTTTAQFTGTTKKAKTEKKKKKKKEKSKMKGSSSPIRNEDENETPVADIRESEAEGE